MDESPQSNAEKSALDLKTYEGALAYTRSLLPLVRQTFDRDGYHSTMAFVMVSRSPETFEPLDEIGIAITAPEKGFTDQASKDAFSDALRDIIVRCEAVGVVFVSEIWMARAEKDEIEKVQRFSRQGSLEHYPGRTEALYVSLEHSQRGHATAFHAEITRPNGKDGPPVVADWREWEGNGKGSTVSGRFANLLKVVH